MLFSAATPMCRKTPYSTGIGMCCKTAGQGVSRARFPEGTALAERPLLCKSLHMWLQHLLPSFPTAQFNFMAFCLSFGFKGFKARTCSWLCCSCRDIAVFREGKHAPSSLPVFQPMVGAIQAGDGEHNTKTLGDTAYGYKCWGVPASLAHRFPFYLLCNCDLAPTLCVAQHGLVFSEA